MIPKIIHYCWFGGNPLPPLALKCIESWRKFLPDYEIKEWNESNFDVNSISYTREAYEAGKYAFVSDYARFYILYHHGGLYFDTDVEVIRPLDDIVECGAFMGCENEVKPGAIALASGPGLGLGCNPGLGLGCNPGLGLYAEILDIYSRLHFKRADGGLNLQTVVKYTTELLVSKGLKNVNGIQQVAGIRIYPKEYFCPMDYQTNKLEITEKTRSIHHFAASWHGGKHKLFGGVAKVIGRDAAHQIAVALKKMRLIR